MKRREAADIQMQRDLAPPLCDAEVSSSALFKSAEEIGEIILNPGQIHFIEENEQHFVFAGLDVEPREVLVAKPRHLGHRPCEFRRLVFSFEVVVETKKVLRTGPPRLHGQAHEIDAKRFRIGHRKRTFSRAADAGEDHQWIDLGCLEAGVECELNTLRIL